MGYGFLSRLLLLFAIFHMFFLSFLFILLCTATDTFTQGELINDGQTLVSAGEIFELGFFSPNEDSSSDTNRYVGIWYYGIVPRTVVWVANRETPLSDSKGNLAIGEGRNLHIRDGTNKSLWSSATLDQTSPSGYNTSVQLMDSGNLVLTEQQNSARRRRINLWQSFDYPSDTLLPGMYLDENRKLVSWKTEQDPSPGKYTFRQDKQGGKPIISIQIKSVVYWRSSTSDDFVNFVKVPSIIFLLTSNASTRITPTMSLVMDPSGQIKILQFNLTSNANTGIQSPMRLVMDPSGQIKLLQLNNMTVWWLFWSEPNEICSVNNACGVYGICNNNKHVPVCKCLPGFQPNSPEKWNVGMFTAGCGRKTQICKDEETFLKLKMMKVGNPDTPFKEAKTEKECGDECRRNCECKAYWYEEEETMERRSVDSSKSKCQMWSEDLKNLEKDFTDGGRDLYVRVATADLGSIAKSCESCGTNIIPYPLSTGPYCGDPLYFSFHCDTSTGQLSFVAPSGNYTVISTINQEKQTFLIQVEDPTLGTCISGANALHLNETSRFFTTTTTNTTITNTDSQLDCSSYVEIGWKPPSEPICNSSKDCQGWPQSTCKLSTTGDGKQRCICKESFHWNPITASCTQWSGNLNQLESSSRNSKPWALIVAGTIISGVLVSCTILFVNYLRRRMMTKREEYRERIQEHPTVHLGESGQNIQDLISSTGYTDDEKTGIYVPLFDLESVLAATDNFSNSNKLGQGGFGPVYKGKLPGGQEIAVKRLARTSGQGLEEFKNEVLLIAKLQHRNLVRLLGYCIKGDEKMLLYEYMPNKSLDLFIFYRTQGVLLNWEKRFDIILGIARGLLYLHQDSRLRIIHRDLKTSNILLDADMNPKISDFGMARIFGGNQTGANTNRVVGTYGYMSPEYALDGFFSVKSDVFSFGVVLLEIISGKRNTGFYQSKLALNLLGYTWKLWKEDKVLNLMDQSLHDSCNISEFLKCTNVALLCVQENSDDRPTMSNVVFMLSNETTTFPTPKQPAFLARRCVFSTGSSSSKPETSSFNEMTITDEQGR